MESEPATGSTVAPRATPVDHLGVIARHRSAVVAVFVWAIGLAALYSFTRTSVFTSEASVLVRPAVTSIGTSEGDVNPDTESQVVGSTAVARIAARELDGHPSIERMLANIEVDVPENTEILRISYSSPDPISAKEGAGAFADAYLEFRRSQAETSVSELMSTLQGELDVLNPEMEDLRTRLTDPSVSDAEASQIRNRLRDLTSRRQTVENQLFVAQTKTIDPGEVIASPLVPNKPSSPNHMLDLALGAIVGLGLGFGLAYVRDRRATGFRSAGELESALGGIAVLGVIPPLREEFPRRDDPIALYRSGGPVSDAYRTLRAAVSWHAEKTRLSTIAVTSARAGEGSTMTSSMLAIALASAGKRVVLINADLRGDPSGHLGQLDHPGLADVLTGAIGSLADVLQATPIPNLSVAGRGAAGPDVDPAELVQPDRMLKVLEECADADFVVIDTPPTLAVADALVIAPLVDGVLLVSAAQGTSRQAIEFARVQLERTGANIVGGVLVGLRLPIGSRPRRPRHRPVSEPLLPTTPQSSPEPSDGAGPVERLRTPGSEVTAPARTKARPKRTRSKDPREGESELKAATGEVAKVIDDTRQAPPGSRLPDHAVPEPLEDSDPVAPPLPPSPKPGIPKRGSKADPGSQRAKTGGSSRDGQPDASAPAAERSPVPATRPDPSGRADRGEERRKTRRPPPPPAEAVDSSAIGPKDRPLEAPDSTSVGPGSRSGVPSDATSAIAGSSLGSPITPQRRSSSRSRRQRRTTQGRRADTPAAEDGAAPLEGAAHTGSTATEGTPAEGTPAEGTPAEGTPAEGTAAEGTPAEGKPAESTPAEGKPAEGTPTETPPAEGAPSETPPAEGAPTETPPESRPAESPPASGQPNGQEGSGDSMETPSPGAAGDRSARQT